MSERAINMRKKNIWILVSIFVFTFDFHVIFLINVFIVKNKNLHQSSAGIGRRLNTHKLIEIRAPIIIIMVIHWSNKRTTTSIIPIGHFIFFTAWVLSSGVFGLMIFCINIQSHFNVRRLWVYVSIVQYLRESSNQYLYSKFVLNVIFSDI